MPDLRAFSQGLRIGQDFSAPIANGLTRRYEIAREDAFRNDILRRQQEAINRQLLMTPGVNPQGSFSDASGLPGTGLTFSRSAASKEEINDALKKRQALFTQGLTEAPILAGVQSDLAAQERERERGEQRGAASLALGLLPPEIQSRVGVGDNGPVDPLAAIGAIQTAQGLTPKPEPGKQILIDLPDGTIGNVEIPPGGVLPQGVKPHVSPQRPERSSALRQEFAKDQVIKDFRTLKDQIGRLKRAMEINKDGGNKVAVDQALITILNKMLDPSSVVRESEYARTPQNLSIKNRLKGQIQQLNTGGAGLTDEDRQAIFEMANNFFEETEKSARILAGQFKEIAVANGHNPSHIIPSDIEEALSQSQPKPANFAPGTRLRQNGQTFVVDANGVPQPEGR